MTIGQSFNDTVAYYDDWMKLALPNYDELFGTATAILPFDPAAPLDVLDMGAGTGLFAWHVLQSYPRARLVLVDLAAKMLDVARDRFAAYSGQVEYIVGDYRDLSNLSGFDLIISSLSIHHLSDLEKRALFQTVYALLRDKGIFVNIDQVKGPTPEISELYWSTWLARVRQSGAPEEQIQASIARRQTYDQDALLVDQLRWLAEAGFTQVDCIYKNYFVGVFLAAK